MTGALRRALLAVRWLVVDGLVPAWRDAALVAVTRTFGVLLSSAALALPILAVTRLATGSPVVFSSWQLHASGSGLALVAGISILLGVLGAAASYASEARAQNVARRYHRTCTARVLRAASAPDAAELLDRVSARTANAASYSDLAIATSMTTAFALRALLECIAPLVYTLAAGAYLTWLDPALSGLLALLAALLLIPFVRASRALAIHQRDYRLAAPLSARRLRRALQVSERTDQRPEPGETTGDGLAGEHARMLDALYGRFMARASTEVVTSLFLVASLCVVFVASGAGAGKDPAGWSGLVVYLVGLRIAWIGVRKLVAEVAQLSRFLTEFERFSWFAEDLRSD